MRTRLNETGIISALAARPGWAREGNQIARLFRFRDHYETIAFVNAVAWISHRHDHHPDLRVGYNTCLVSYTTHDASGLTALDFTCATAVDALID